MKGLVKKISFANYSEEKRRFLLFGLCLLLTLFAAIYLLRIAYARYESHTRLNGNIEKALYLFGDDSYTFNIFPEGIVPKDEEYIYKFSVSNFQDSKMSDVDIEYEVSVRTTTNLPISLELYRNEEYSATATNLFGNAKITHDVDNAWYREYGNAVKYEMKFEDKVTDIYTLVIKFPKSYAKDTTYANYLESIELHLDSQQII